MPVSLAGLTTKKPEHVKKIGHRVDVIRWDVRTGRALIAVADWLLAQPDEAVRDFLPALAIAAARERQYKSAAKRARADAVLAKLRPYVERSECVADLVARSGCHFIRVHEATAPAALLYDLAKGCAAIRRNVYLLELRSAVG